ncbi:MAG: ABC transporter ATP-binding protein [Acidimicrobiales bacterium]
MGRRGESRVEFERGQALNVRGVSSGYGDLQVLRDVSLVLEPGRLEVLLGRNGAGKTTLLSTITGLLPCWKGSISYGSYDLTKTPVFRRCRGTIALVQEGKRIFRGRTVEQNIALGAYSARLNRTQTRQLVAELVTMFPSLSNREHTLAGTLSGGQQQMLAVAQALASEPSVLILDEPSAGLAPVVINELFTRIAGLRDNGLTILLVEQLADQALKIADHVTVLNNGAVADSGAPEKFRDRQVLHRAYFGGGTSADGHRSPMEAGAGAIGGELQARTSCDEENEISDDRRMWKL